MDNQNPEQEKPVPPEELIKEHAIEYLRFYWMSEETKMSEVYDDFVAKNPPSLKMALAAIRAMVEKLRDNQPIEWEQTEEYQSLQRSLGTASVKNQELVKQLKDHVQQLEEARAALAGAKKQMTAQANEIEGYKKTIDGLKMQLTQHQKNAKPKGNEKPKTNDSGAGAPAAAEAQQDAEAKS